jgi:arginyl-tRNA synthetase
VWLRTTDFGDDKDRVLVKSNGEPTYLAPDIAYFMDKVRRGFTRLIYLWGADHHGHVPRMQIAIKALGEDPEHAEFIIGQLVSLTRGGVPVRMSKRTGELITFDELLDEVGRDAARYLLVRQGPDTPLDFDIEQAIARTQDNPVFYVQYAHARVSSLLRNAEDLGVERGELRPELLEHDREGDLLGALGEYPRVVATAAELREVHRVARYLESLAGTYHRFYDVCRVLPRGDEDVTDLHRARLWLVEATRVVLANGLSLLGVNAPERM